MCVCVCLCLCALTCIRSSWALLPPPPPHSSLPPPPHSSPDDYRFTAAMSLLKLLVTRGVCPSLHATPPEEDAGLTPLSPPQLPPSHEPEKSPRLPPKTPASRGQQHGGRSPGKSPSKSNAAEGTADGSVGETPLQLAMKACQAYLDSHEHKDIEGNHHHSVRPLCRGGGAVLCFLVEGVGLCYAHMHLLLRGWGCVMLTCTSC